MTLPVSVRTLAKNLLGWYRKSRRELPWRDQPEPYRVWISEIMLQQTRVKAVLPYFERFLKRFPTVESLAAAEVEDVLAAWSGLGYYRRARHLHASAVKLMHDHQGSFPADFGQVLQLPGIGRYTAGAILSIAFGKPFPVLDGNVRRVMARYLFLENLDSKKERKLWSLLEKLVRDPAISPSVSDFNQGLMELGATVCTPLHPKCPDCPLNDSCRAFQAGAQQDLPRRRPRKAGRRFDYIVALIKKGDRYLLRQNVDTPFLDGFWEFPRIPGKPGPELGKRLRRALGMDLTIFGVLAPVRHQITFRKLHFHPVLCALQESGPEDARWTWSRLPRNQLPIPAYVEKIRLRAEHQDS